MSAILGRYIQFDPIGMRDRGNGKKEEKDILRGEFLLSPNGVG